MDNLLWGLSAVAQACVAGLGFWLTLSPRLAERHPKALAIGFGVLTAIALAASGVGFVRASNANATVTVLTEQILNEVKGSPDATLALGPNFTKSQGGDYENGVAVIAYHNESKHSMIDTDIWVSGTRHIERDMLGYHRKIGDIYPDRGGQLPNFAVQLRKDAICEIEFGIRSRSTVMWQRLYFQWNGNGWVSDSTAFKEKDGIQVYILELRPNSPFAKIDAQRKKWAAESAAEKEKYELEQAKNK